MHRRTKSGDIVREIYRHSFLHSRICFKPDSQFFSPLRFILDQTHHAAVPTSFHNELPKREIVQLETGNLFARLLFSADRLAHLIQNDSAVISQNFDKLLQFLDRQNSEKLERYSEEMLHLCILTHSMVESSLDNLDLEKKTCVELMSQLNHPSGRWDPMIRNIIADFSANILPQLCGIFATYGLEGSNRETKSSNLTTIQQGALQEIQTNILIMIDDDPSSMDLELLVICQYHLRMRFH